MSKIKTYRVTLFVEVDEQYCGEDCGPDVNAMMDGLEREWDGAQCVVKDDVEFLEEREGETEPLSEMTREQKLQRLREQYNALIIDLVLSGTSYDDIPPI